MIPSTGCLDKTVVKNPCIYLQMLTRHLVRCQGDVLPVDERGGVRDFGVIKSEITRMF